MHVLFVLLLLLLRYKSFMWFFFYVRSFPFCTMDLYCVMEYQINVLSTENFLLNFNKNARMPTYTGASINLPKRQNKSLSAFNKRFRFQFFFSCVCLYFNVFRFLFISFEINISTFSSTEQNGIFNHLLTQNVHANRNYLYFCLVINDFILFILSFIPCTCIFVSSLSNTIQKKSNEKPCFIFFSNRFCRRASSLPQMNNFKNGMRRSFHGKSY